MDPLKPFTTLISSLSRTRSENKTSTERTARTDTNSQHSVSQRHIAEASSATAVKQRIRERIISIGRDGDAQRARREAFVEIVLANELGDGLLRDPAFAEVVRHVADQLGDDASLRDQLDSLLLQLHSEPANY